MAHAMVPDDGTSAPAPGGSIWCSDCRTSMRSYYYALDTRPVCPKCRMTYAAKIARGAGPGAMGRALLYGAGAAALSAVVLGGVILTVGILRIFLSIAVGIVVGKAINAATGSYLATKYRIMAAVLTYFAIGLGNLAPVFKAISEIEEPPHAVEVNPTTDIVAAEPDILPPPVKPRTSTDYDDTDMYTDLEAELAAAQAERKASAKPAEAANAEQIVNASIGKAFGIVAILFLTLPLLSGLAYGLHGAALTLLAVVYGVYKAWAITGDGTAEVITGPHKVGTGPITHTI